MSKSLTENTSTATVTVRGSAEICRLPDTSYVLLSVNTFDADLAKAQSVNAETANALIEKISEIIKFKSDIITSGYNLHPQYDYKDNTKILRGYNVANSLRVKVTDFTLISRIIDIAGLNGANQISGIEFALKDSAAAYNNALKIALKNARKKAELLAAQESCKLGAVIEITEHEQSSFGAVPVMARNLSFDAAASTPVNAGQITVKAAVEVKYSLV